MNRTSRTLMPPRSIISPARMKNGTARRMKLPVPLTIVCGSTTKEAARAERLRPVIAELMHLSARAAAAELNRRKIETPAGGDWHAVTVIRLRERLNLPRVRAGGGGNK